MKRPKYWAWSTAILVAFFLSFLLLKKEGILPKNKLTKIAFAQPLTADKQFTFFLLGSGSCSLSINFGDQSPVAHLSGQLPLEGQHNYFEKDFEKVNKNSKNYVIEVKSNKDCENLIADPVIVHVVLPNGCQESPCKASLPFQDRFHRGDLQ